MTHKILRFLFKQVVVFILFALFVNNLFSIKVNYDYSFDKVVEKGNNLSIEYLNISFNQSFSGELRIFLDKDLVFSKNFSGSNIYLENLSFKIEKIYEILAFKIFDEQNNPISSKEEKLYVYNFLSNICEIKNDKIVEEDEDLEIKIKLKNEDLLEKEVHLFLDGSLEKDYNYDEDLKKETELEADKGVKEFKCKVLIVEDNLNKEIFNYSEKILVYNIDPLSFEFDDEETIKVDIDDFELSNSENKVELEISLDKYKYFFEFKNETNINDFDINIFDSEDIKDEDDKIELIKTILEGISSEKGLEIEYSVKLYLYENGSLIDDKEVLDKTYYLKYYESKGEIEIGHGENDFSLDIIEMKEEVEILNNLNAKLLLEIKDGDKFDLEVCMAFYGRSYCKTVFLEEDEEEEKTVEFSINLDKNIKPGNYKVYFYAYDEDKERILWKSKNIKIKPLEAVKIELENQVIIGKKGEKKDLSILIENFFDKEISIVLKAECGDQLIKKAFSLKAGEIKKVSLPFKIEENCEGKITSNVKNIGKSSTFSVIVKEDKRTKENIKEKEQKEKEKIKKEIKDKKSKESFYCKLDKDFIYSNEDIASFKIEAPKGTKVIIRFNKEKILVNPYEFEIKEEKTVKIIRNTNEKIIENINVICEKGNNSLKKDVLVYFKEKNSFKKDDLLLISVGFLALLVLIVIVIYFLR